MNYDNGHCDTLALMQEHVLGLVKEALKLADAKPSDISCIAYTKARQALCAVCIACYA